MKILAICAGVLVPAVGTAANPDATASEAPRVFLDCDRCDFSYTRVEIPFVNWVRDREDAVLHILITDQRTGSGGRDYSLDFLGLRRHRSTS